MLQPDESSISIIASALSTLPLILIIQLRRVQNLIQILIIRASAVLIHGVDLDARGDYLVAISAWKHHTRGHFF